MSNHIQLLRLVTERCLQHLDLIWTNLYFGCAWIGWGVSVCSRLGQAWGVCCAQTFGQKQESSVRNSHALKTKGPAQGCDCTCRFSSESRGWQRFPKLSLQSYVNCQLSATQKEIILLLKLEKGEDGMGWLSSSPFLSRMWCVTKLCVKGTPDWLSILQWCCTCLTFSKLLLHATACDGKNWTKCVSCSQQLPY